MASLPDLGDVRAVWRLADRRLAKGDAVFVADLGIALAGAYGSATDGPWQYRSVLDHLLRLLTTAPGRENVEQALRLISAAGRRPRTYERYAASLLASSQTADDLAAAFVGGGSSGGASDELRACLVQEMILRGIQVAEVPGIGRWAMSAHRRLHPLGWLPLSPAEMEQHPDLPSYGVRGSSHSMPYGPSEGRGLVLDRGAPVPAFAERTSPAVTSAVSTAVTNWAEESNGRIEARVFELSEPLRTEAVPGLLAALGLECLKGLGPRTTFSVTACPAAQVWRVLFSAASTGGAYNSGCHGAYGRLAAWQSLAGLVGAPDGASACEVEARTNEADWYCFETSTKWFDQVAWDIGLLAVAPGRMRLAVLAATDTD